VSFSFFTLKNKIYFLSLLSSLFLIFIGWTGYSTLAQLSQNFQDFTKTSEFANKNITLAREVEMLKGNVQKFTYTGLDSALIEANNLYAKIKTYLDDSKVPDDLPVAKSFALINTHLEKYFTTFKELEKQISTQKNLKKQQKALIEEIEINLETYLSDSTGEKILMINLLRDELHDVDKTTLYYADSLESRYIKQIKKHIKTLKARLKIIIEKEKREKNRSELLMIEEQIDTFTKTTIAEIQHIRSYLFLVNVVMAAESYEVLYQANLINDASQKILEKIDVEFNDQIARAIKTLSLTGLILLVSMVVIAIVVARSVIRPIGLLTESFNELSKGNTDAVIPVYDVNDEVGALTQAASTFRDKNKEIHNLLEHMKELSENLIEAKTQADVANKAKSAFLASMSHEIRTPLNAIIGFINVLSKEETDPKKLEYLRIVQNSSGSLLGVINDILDISKIEDGKLDIEKIDFDVRQQIDELIKFYGSTMDARDITLNLNVRSSVPHSLKSDPLRLKQVLSNLISNAIKFSSENSTVNVDVDYKDSQLFVSVRDEGIGITEEAKQRIFNAFEQAESSTTRSFGGTGLGLAICKKLVKLMGGKITVQSEFEKGSVFSFYIDAPESAKNVDEVAVNKEYAFEGHVLVAEDNKTNQMLIKILLDEMGVSYTVVDDGEEAVNTFLKEDFDLILMDINMPKLDGIQATKRVRQADTEHRAIPIVALTANAMKEDVEAYHEAGMNAHVAKPIDANLLAKELSKFLPEKG
jgi:signal transduction histidine kinase/ActR/RegA family two-component response regulator